MCSSVETEGRFAVSHTTRYAGPERRDTSPEGIAWRALFQPSLYLVKLQVDAPKRLGPAKHVRRVFRVKGYGSRSQPLYLRCKEVLSK